MMVVVDFSYISFIRLREFHSIHGLLRVFLAVSVLSCSTWDLFIAVHGLFIAAHRLLSSCGVWAPEHAGSVVAACRLSSCGMQAQ